MRTKHLVAALTLVLPSVAASISSLHAQQETGVWQPTDTGNWNEADNWDINGFSGIPAVDPFGDHAEVSNGGTAIVDADVPDIADLTISNGTVQIESNGSLTAIALPDPDDGGNLNIGGAGVLSLAGDASFTAELDAVNNGLISINGPNASFDIDGNFDNNGVIEALIVGDSHTPITVGGTADLGGSLRPSFDAAPNLGDAWTIVQASLVSGGIDLDLVNAPMLAAGNLYDTRNTGGSLELLVRNSLVLTVNRESGAATLSNPSSAPIEFTGFSVTSENGFVNPDGMTLLGADWQGVPTADATQAAQLNPSTAITLGAGEQVSIGSGYLAGPQSPLEEDVALQYVTGAGDVFDGVVEYVGAISDLVLNVDPATGEAAISLLSPFFPDSDVVGYTVESASGSLLTDYSTFADNPGAAGPGWFTVNGSANGVGELNPEQSFEYSQGDVTPLGALFSVGGEQDLVFKYALSSGDVLAGTVSYGAIPDVGPLLPGDVNGDGRTDLTDFNILKENFGATGPEVSRGVGDLDGNMSVDLTDFNILKDDFGNAAAAVPEPASWLLAVVAAAAIAGRRRSA